jgi:DNA-binding NarL/FixJ family response regulator
MEDYDTIFKAFTKGATGYLLKKMSLQRIEAMLLETIEEGGSAMSPQIARRMLKYFNPSNHRNEGFEHLTSSEEQILKFLIDGKTYNEIASLLDLSINGVKYHIKNLYQKLDVTSRHQLISIFK